MILADTSVWVEHLRRGEPRLADLLEAGEVGCHPFVIGELACGHLRRRADLLELLSALPALPKLEDLEILDFIDRRGLHGKGLGLIDVHLLASCVLAGAALWTADARLARVAAQAGLAID